MWEKLAELSVGLAAFLGGLFLVLQIVKTIKQPAAVKNGANRAGERSTEEWEGRMRKMHEESEERLMRDFRTLMDARNEAIRRLIREELERK
jgi:hypothetical protein